MKIDKQELLNQQCSLYGGKIVLREDTHTQRSGQGANRKELYPPHSQKGSKTSAQIAILQLIIRIAIGKNIQVVRFYGRKKRDKL